MNADRHFKSSNSTQESQYGFPYHYIPVWDGGHFSQHISWSWGYRYMGALKLVLDLLAETSFESLLDIGCGDGRLIKEINNRFAGKRLRGTDISDQAIALARALNPGLDYSREEISGGNESNELYDIITMIDVIEHITKEQLPAFMENASRFSRSGGVVIVTVPHESIRITPKHCQHFNAKSLHLIMEPYYEVERLIFFERRSCLQSVVMGKVLENSLFVLNNRLLLGFLFRLYLKYFFSVMNRNVDAFAR